MNERPKLLLLGDSIRGSYQSHVKAALDEIADVVSPDENCQYSLYTLSALNRWLQTLGTPDIIHWNNGLHDCGHNPNRSPVQIPLEMYIANLSFCLEILRGTEAHIVWATTTPVHPERPFLSDRWSWRNEEIDAYNEAARDLFTSEGIPLNDLHGLIWSGYDRYLSEDKLHLNDEGQRACAEAVVEAVSKYIPKAGT